MPTLSSPNAPPPSPTLTEREQELTGELAQVRSEQERIRGELHNIMEAGGLEGYEFGMGSAPEPARLQDQFEWEPEDVDRMWRDRYEAEQVRLMYTITNPEEFPNLFTDEVEEGEERITPANLLSGGTPDPVQPNLTAHDREEVRDAAWYGELIEMHQTQDFSERPRRPDPPPPVIDDESDDGGDSDGHGREEFNRNDFYIPSHDGRRCHWEGVEPWRDDISDASFEHDPGHDIDWSPFESLTELLLHRVQGEADQLDEDGRQEFIMSVLHGIEDSSRLFLPRWHDDAMTRLANAIAESEVDRRDNIMELEFQDWEGRRMDDAYDEARELRRRYRDSLAEHQQFCEEFDRLDAEFAATEGKTAAYRQWGVVRDKVKDLAKSDVRRLDMLSWYPWLPDNLRGCIERFATFHRQVACMILDIRTREGIYNDTTYTPNPLDELDWAAVCSQTNEAFGYETTPNVTGGFTHFIPPSADLTILASLKQIEAASTLRCCRMLLAFDRLSQRPEDAHDSDYRIAGQYVLWLDNARAYLARLQTEDPRAANMIPQLHEAIDSVRSYMNTVEGVVFQNWHGTAQHSVPRGFLSAMNTGARNPEAASQRGMTDEEVTQWADALEAEARRLEAERDELYRDD